MRPLKSKAPACAGLRNARPQRWSASAPKARKPRGLAWLDCSVKQRMECGDHWLIYAQVGSGALLDAEATTAVHQRRSGANY